MKSFRLAMRADRNVECLELLRGFIRDISNMENTVKLVIREKEIARLLENEMDLLTADERYKIYGFMEGVFPKRFKRVLSVRLRRENDPKCLELLRAIADLHK